MLWKDVAVKPDDLRLISRTHMIEGRTGSHRLCSGLHVYIMEYINRQINKKVLNMKASELGSLVKIQLGFYF